MRLATFSRGLRSTQHLHHGRLSRHSWAQKSLHNMQAHPAHEVINLCSCGFRLLKTCPQPQHLGPARSEGGVEEMSTCSALKRTELAHVLSGNTLIPSLQSAIVCSVATLSWRSLARCSSSQWRPLRPIKIAGILLACAWRSQVANAAIESPLFLWRKPLPLDGNSSHSSWY